MQKITIGIPNETIYGSKEIDDLVRRSKNGADEYTKLYHCAPSDALMSIIINKAFWLSNLKDVNDKEEPKRIDIPEYEKSYYVACFTSLNDVSDDHWDEYGKTERSVLFSVKKDWFIQAATFMTVGNQKCTYEEDLIMRSESIAHKEMVKQLKQDKQINPYFIQSYGFFKIIYDDDLKITMQTKGKWNAKRKDSLGNYINPALSGIVKNTKGQCERDGLPPYVKNWEAEKEVRLKLCIRKRGNSCTFCYYPKIAIPLKENGFDEFDIRFNPKFPESEKVDYLRELHDLLPESKITVLE